MKKCLSNRNVGYYSAAKRRYLRRLLGKQRSAQIKGAHWSYPTLRNRNGAISFVRILAPQVLTIAKEIERRDLIRFISKFRQILLNGKGGVIADFSQVRSVFPCGGLLLLAEIDRVCRIISDSRRLRCKSAKHDSLPDQVFNQIGLYGRFQYDRIALPTDQSVIHWRMASGVKAEGEEAGAMLDTCEGDLTDTLKTSLYRGITEAMTNAVQHAYIAIRHDGTRVRGDKRWWMFSQERDGFLKIVFCDLGIGIPVSLPMVNSTMQTALKLVRRDRSDVEAIRMATKLGSTSTSERYRGKGLPEILDAAGKSEQGYCLIYSNRGQFGFAAGGQTVENQFSDTILGTLIEWRVPTSES